MRLELLKTHHCALQVMEKMASGIPMDNGTLENPRGKAQELLLLDLNPQLIAPLNRMIS